MKKIYQTPDLKEELLHNEDIVAVSGYEPPLLSKSEIDNTYVNNFSIFNYN